MNCIICGTQIDKPEEQFGDIKSTMCQSDYLNGMSWVYDDPQIVMELERGASLEDAIKTCVKVEITELEKFAYDLLNNDKIISGGESGSPA